jgi:hypothetical protein
MLGYLYDFVFTSRTEKIAEIAEVRGVRQTSTMVKTLMQRLSGGGKGHVIFLDNFFSTVELFINLKRLRIGACGTCKAGSGIPQPLIKLRGALSQRQWGYMRLLVAQEKETVYYKSPGRPFKTTKRPKESGESIQCAVW